MSLAACLTSPVSRNYVHIVTLSYCCHCPTDWLPNIKMAGLIWNGPAGDQVLGGGWKCKHTKVALVLVTDGHKANCSMPM